MGYKEKYESALERAKIWKDKSGMPKDRQGILDDIFPELAESEDERIRKKLIIAFQSLNTIKVWNGIERTDILSWLEKQSKSDIDCPQNHQDSSRPNGCIVLEDFNGGEGFYKLNLDYLNKKQVEEVEEMVKIWNKESSNENIKDCIGMCLTDVNEQRFKDYNTNLKECLAWLEKQEQKPVKDTDEDIVEAVKDTSILDMVEPKFHEGEWITNGDYTWKIVEVKPLDYILQSQDGNIVDDTISHVDGQFHSFTIQDAKDGDILYSLDSKQPFIYKNRKPFNQAEAYCGINIFGKFFVWNTKDCVITLDKYVPATKEQRELLFQRMHEAGYMWDSYSKQLLSLKAEPSGKQKSTEWSEEDENNLTDTCVAIRKFYHGINGAQELIDWLQDIKQRVKGE